MKINIPIGIAAGLLVCANGLLAADGLAAVHEYKSGGSNWRVAAVDGPVIRLDLCDGSNALRRATARIQIADGTMLEATNGGWKRDTFRFQFPRGLEIRCHFEVIDHGWLRIEPEVFNHGRAAESLRQVVLLADTRIESVPAPNRVFSQSETMAGKTGVFKLEGAFESFDCVGFSDAAGSQALLAGFEKPADTFYKFEVAATNADTCFSAVCPREDIALAAGGGLKISPLLLRFDPSLSALLDGYAARAAKALAARTRKPLMTGWCSWYYYYGKETASNILTNARAIAGSSLKGQVRVIQIDDGWNLPHPGDPRAWGDWFPGSKFPQGMKAVVDEIHGLGFQAGLWLAPFSADKTSKLVAEHPDWLVRAKNPKTGALEPAAQGSVYSLDLTNPEVLAWLRQTFNRVFYEWGFDYVKIDFLVHGTCQGIRYDQGKTGAEAYRMGVSVVRDCAGKSKFVLCCGSPLGPAIGLCDGMRIGFDVGGIWDVPMNPGVWPHGNCSILPAAYPSLFRQWQNHVWWQNDPDCLVVRDRPVSFEVKNFERLKQFFNGTNSGGMDLHYGLSRDEAEFWTRAVWLTGGMTIFSEVWPELPPERQDLIQRALQSHGQNVKLLDDYEFPDVCVLKSTGGPQMVGLFNLSDEPRTVAFPAGRLGGTKDFHEWLNGEPLQLEGGTARFPTLAPHSARIWIAGH